MYKGYLTDIEGIRVGHAEYKEGISGCTAILFDQEVTCGGDVRGGGPGTRETDLLNSMMSNDSPHAVVLSGGSNFGVDSMVGVTKYLEEQNIGMDTGFGVMPIVAGAILFDLFTGDFNVRSDRFLGYEAAKNATNEPGPQGNVGAGIGATVGKFSMEAIPMKGGLGSATVEAGDLKVSAMVAVNAIGDVYDYETRELIGAGIDPETGEMVNSIDVLKSMHTNTSKANTTIGIVATNANLTKAQANKIGEMTHNGYARVLNPIHTAQDGDTIFCVSTNKVNADMALIGTLAADAMSKAIMNAIKNADTLGPHKSYKEVHNK